ncbi:MAG: VWA-like domain-containing protein [Acidimicrobiales bacterium]
MTGAADDGALDGSKLAAARLWATTRHPYLASAVFASPASPAPGLGRLVIDRWWRIHADPSVVAGSSVNELGGELLHLALHVVRDHAGRADRVGLAEPAELHHWVDATDAEIVDDLPADMARVSPSATADDLGAEVGRLAEEYYRRGIVRDGATADCGSGAHGRLAGWEPPPPRSDDDPGVRPDDQRLLRRRVASDIADAAAGTVAPGLRAWAAEELGSRVDWRAELAALLRRSLSTVGGAVDYSYRRPSRRASVGTGVVLPALRRPTVEVAVVVDTSASVSDRALASAVAEIDGLLRASGTRSVRVLACDDAVHTVRRVTDGRQVDLVGGGGTDMGVGIATALDHRPPPRLIVVVTDGITPWPPEPPPAEVVVALLGVGDAGVPPTPAWARAVLIPRPTDPGR